MKKQGVSTGLTNTQLFYILDLSGFRRKSLFRQTLNFTPSMIFINFVLIPVYGYYTNLTSYNITFLGVIMNFIFWGEEMFMRNSYICS